MRVIITGAGGFIGRLLVEQLLRAGSLRGSPIQKLILLDFKLHGFADDSRLRLHEGDITDATLLRRTLADGADVVFHLAGLLESAAEKQYAQGRKINLMASLELLDQLRNREKPSIVIFASSVSVYGPDLPARVDEHVTLKPNTSYGAHKLMIETHLNDLTRRSELDGRSLRFPELVARPGASNDFPGSCVSNLIRAVAESSRYVCPLSPTATAWCMSARRCVENLVHAAELETSEALRCWQLPVLQVTVGEVFEALIEEFGEARRSLISFEVGAEPEDSSIRSSLLRAPTAKALGFIHDGTVQFLIRNALNLPSRPRRTRANHS